MLHSHNQLNNIYKKVTRAIKKSLIVGFIFLFMFATLIISGLSSVLATGADTSTSGAQGTTGVQGQTGSQGTIGAQGQTGPSGTTGTQSTTGIQSATGPQSESSTNQTNLQTQSTSNTSSLTNSQTGSASQNTNNNSSGSNSNISVSNDANINNNAGVKIDTGDNSVGTNTVVGSINTGNINGAVNLINVSNSQFAPGSTIGSQLINAAGLGQIFIAPSNSRVSLTNSDTGAQSQNLNSFSNPNIVTVFDLNNATNNNGINIDTNTGNNILSANTKAGNLTTGNINLGINLLNLANLIMPNTVLTTDIYNIIGPLNGQIVIPELANSATGNASANQNLLSSSNNLGVSVTSNATNNNLFDVQTNTGDNTIGNNTVTGDVSTGNSTVKNVITNLANIAAGPVFYLINVFGKWTGQILGLDPSRVIVNQINTNTGDNSQNQNAANLNNSANLAINNNADVSNAITINANTGGNLVKNNTIVGNIKTGSINITNNIVNILNSLSNSVGHFALRIINIFGDWNGNAVGSATFPNSGKGSHAQKISSSVISSSNQAVLGASTTRQNGNLSSKISSSLPITGAELSNPNDPHASNLLNHANAQTISNPVKARNSNSWKIILIGVIIAFFAGWLALEIMTLRRP